MWVLPEAGSNEDRASLGSLPATLSLRTSVL